MNANLPTIDVVTVCYNAESTIEKTLKSVFCEREHIANYFVIDGGSNDNTLDIIEKYRYIVSELISEPDDGISDAFNKGIQLSSSNFVLLLNADDWLIEGSLSRVRSLLRQDDEIVCTIMHSYRGGDFLGAFSSSPEKMPKGNFMLHPGAIISRQIYAQVGLYDGRYEVGMDYDFFSRCYMAGKTFRILEEPLVCFQEGGVSRVRLIANISDSYAIRKKYFNANFPGRELIGLFMRVAGALLRSIGAGAVVDRIRRRIIR